jgi:hypothetical protein
MNRNAVTTAIIRICLTLSAVILFDVTNAAHHLAMFMIAGQIPGTQYFVSADTMLFLSVVFFGVLAGRMTSHIIKLSVNKLPTSQTA